LEINENEIDIIMYKTSRIINVYDNKNVISLRRVSIFHRFFMKASAITSQCIQCRIYGMLMKCKTNYVWVEYRWDWSSIRFTQLFVNFFVQKLFYWYFSHL